MLDYINTLYAKADELASGSMRGGTQRAAYTFIESLRGLDPAEAKEVLQGAIAASEGPYHDWLVSLPSPDAQPALSGSEK